MWKTAYCLIAIVLILLTLGLVMLASTSGVKAAADTGDAMFYLKRQGIFLALALALGFAAARFDYHHLRWLALPLALFAGALLVAVLIPGIGLNINGSRRWLKAGPVNYQPSELAKIAVIVLLAWWMKRNQRRAHEFLPGLLAPMLMLAPFLLLVFIEPDFGSTMLMAVVGLGIIFLGGAPPGWLLVFTAGGGALFVVAIMENAVRMRRILAFMDPEAYAQTEGYQLLNALYAFVVGGPYGAGLGGSLQKQFYLPEAHTDFIFAIIGEELGLPASLGVLALFLGFFVCGQLIAWRAPDRFGRLLAAGVTLLITLQALINIAVVTGRLPTKGLALPFISYGGSAMITNLALVGLLVNIALHSGGMVADTDTRAIKDRVRRV